MVLKPVSNLYTWNLRSLPAQLPSGELCDAARAVERVESLPMLKKELALIQARFISSRRGSHLMAQG